MDIFSQGRNQRGSNDVGQNPVVIKVGKIDRLAQVTELDFRDAVSA
jgi:hypothetical protein